jgi:serine/threonine-protein kinase
VGCLDENVLAEYVDGVLGPSQRRAADQHLDTCATCRAAVSNLARMQHAIGDSTVDDAVGDYTNQTTLAVPLFDGPVRPSAETFDAAYHRKRTAHIVPGTMIGEYEVTGTLGAGGMGVVFAAIHPRIGKKAAIKILQRSLARNPSAIARFENEARAVNAIAHPNIVDIFSFGELPSGDPYYVMEHVDGESLQDWIRSHGAVPLERAMPILRQICDALAAAHARGIIHRDLKPANIMVGGTDDTPRVKVLDFGLAKMMNQDLIAGDLTNPGMVLGTPYFMSPEQFEGREVDQRSDVYALGVLVYQMLCGKLPFLGATPTAVREQHLHHTPAPLSKVSGLSARVDQVIDKALAKDVSARFASVRVLRDDLESCVGLPARPVTGPSPPDEEGERPTFPSLDGVSLAPRRRIPIWALAGAGLGIVAFVIAWLVGRSSESLPTSASAPPPVETVEDSAAPPPVVTPIEPPPAAPAVKPPDPAPKPPHRAAPHPVVRPTKPVAPPPKPPTDDDRMLLEGGSIKKKP